MHVVIPGCVIVLLAVSLAGLRLTSLAFSYAVVRADIPVVNQPVNDAAYHTYTEQSSKTIGAQTTTIVLDSSGNLYFGELNAFAGDYQNVRNKFIVRSVDYAPQTGVLLQGISAWQKQSKKSGDDSEGVAILIPAQSTPMPVVIQVLADIRYSEQFDRVILGGGLL